MGWQSKWEAKGIRGEIVYGFGAETNKRMSDFEGRKGKGWRRSDDISKQFLIFVYLAPCRTRLRKAKRGNLFMLFFFYCPPQID